MTPLAVPPAPPTGQQAAHDRVHDAGDGARNGGERVRKVAAGENHPQPRVLHADLNGNGAGALQTEACEARDRIAEGKPTGVEQAHGEE